MPTRSIDFTPEQDAFVEEVIKTGQYASASEAVRDAMAGLQVRHQGGVSGLATLRAQLEAGAAALDAGRYTEIDDAELDVELDKLAVEAS